MSAALDTLSPEEQKLLDQMQADDAASGIEEAPPPASPLPPDEPPAPAEEPPATTEPPKTTVPQEALHAERERRKRAEKELNELKARAAADIAVGQERLRLLTEAASAATAPPAPAPVQIPDPQTDPLGYVQATTSQLQNQIAQLNERVQKTEGLERQVAEASLQQAQMAELRMWGQGQEADFRAENPDYDNAANHLRTQRETQLRALGYTNPAEINNILAGDITAMAMRARQTGQNFGEMVYRLAAAVGYQKAAAAPTPAAAVAPPAAPAAPAAPDPAARVAAAQRGAEMAGGLGGAGAAPRGELTPQALANMTEAEFASMYSKLQGNPAAMRQMFGE